MIFEDNKITAELQFCVLMWFSSESDVCVSSRPNETEALEDIFPEAEDNVEHYLRFLGCIVEKLLITSLAQILGFHPCNLFIFSGPLSSQEIPKRSFSHLVPSLWVVCFPVSLEAWNQRLPLDGCFV